MFESVPPETFVLKTLLADLHDDLEGRVTRLRVLLALEADVGSGRRLILPGGTPAFQAYVETRQAFVFGNYLTVVIMSQCLIENALAAQIGIEAVSAEVHGRTPPKQKGRPVFKETIAACVASKILDEADAADLVRLSELRNSSAHFRAVNDPTHLDRRAMSERRPAFEIGQDDARFAISVFVRILAKPPFRLSCLPESKE